MAGIFDTFAPLLSDNPVQLAQAATGDLLPADTAAMEAFMNRMGAKPSKPVVPVAPAAPIVPAAPVTPAAPDPLNLKRRTQERMKGTSLFEPIYAAANGGTFGRGDTVLVGEKGPELVKFNQRGTVIPTMDPESSSLAGFLRLLFGGEFTSAPTRSGSVGASPLDRRGPQFGVQPAPAQPVLAGVRPGAVPAVIPAASASAVGGAKPKLPDQTQLDLIDQMQKQHDMYRSLVPKPSPPILGSRG